MKILFEVHLTVFIKLFGSFFLNSGGIFEIIEHVDIFSVKYIKFLTC